MARVRPRLPIGPLLWRIALALALMLRVGAGCEAVAMAAPPAAHAAMAAMPVGSTPACHNVPGRRHSPVGHDAAACAACPSCVAATPWPEAAAPAPAPAAIRPTAFVPVVAVLAAGGPTPPPPRRL